MSYPGVTVISGGSQKLSGIRMVSHTPLMQRASMETAYEVEPVVTINDKHLGHKRPTKYKDVFYGDPESMYEYATKEYNGDSYTVVPKSSSTGGFDNPERSEDPYGVIVPGEKIVVTEEPTMKSEEIEDGPENRDTPCTN